MENKENVQASVDVQEITVVGFGRRLAAAVIDGLIILFFTFGISLGVILLLGYINAFAEDADAPVTTVVILSGLAVSFIYYVWFWTKSGQTFAKSVLGTTPNMVPPSSSNSPPLSQKISKSLSLKPFMFEYPTL